MKAVHLALAILFTLATLAVRADPSPEIRRLMDEPVSMLDWGLEGLRQDLTEQLRNEAASLGFSARDLILFTGYDWDHNQIDISITTPLVPRVAAKADCRRLIEWVRQKLVIRGKDRKPFSFWVSMFQHNGYVHGQAADKALADKLPQLVMVSATTWPAGKQITPVNCSGALLDDSISYEEK